MSTRAISVVIICVQVFASDATAFPQIAPAERVPTSELLRQLGELPASLAPSIRSDGRPNPVEQRRQQLYLQLRALGTDALPALIRGLTDPEVGVRRNVALFLSCAAGNWYTPLQPRLDIQSCLPALITALRDSDARVRGLAAQAIGEIGSQASPAVPALVRLLSDRDEGSRNSACIGLAGIGPAARDALPALRKALSDSSTDVRGFAERAIRKIETQ